MVILGSSTNIPAAFNAFALSGSPIGLDNLIEDSLKWAQAHNYMLGMTSANVLGPVGYAYVASLIYVYLPLAGLLILHNFVAIIAYIWVSLPLAVLVVLLGFCFAVGFIQGLYPFCRGGDTYDGLLQPKESLEAKEEALRALGVDIENAREDYNGQMGVYRSTGVPDRAWVGYVVSTFFFSPWVQLFAPVAARLYTGHGYMASLTTTFGERHLSVYLCTVAGSGIAKLGLVWLFF